MGSGKGKGEIISNYRILFMVKKNGREVGRRWVRRGLRDKSPW